MSVRQREPIDHSGTLVNNCNIGVLTLNDDASQVDCALLCSDGSYISFSKAKGRFKTPAKLEAESLTKAETE
jgi:hypothetical protein